MSGRLSVAPVLSIGPIGERGGGGKEFDGPNFPHIGVQAFCLFFSGYLYIYSQNSIFVIESAKIIWFLRFSIARIRPKFKKICQISIHGFR
jgi:hypothetical protein